LKRFGLIGYPLTHSFSGKYFSEKFSREDISDCAYDLYPMEDIEGLPALVSGIPELLGLNITIPHKVSVIPFLTELDDISKAIGAVNTVKISRKEGKIILTGYNTDAYGFEMSLKSALQPEHRKALVLGTGGASRAVRYVLGKLGIDYVLVSRNPDRQQGEVGYEDLNDSAVRNFPLIINTSPLGMHPRPDTFPPLPYEHLSEINFLYDLVYNPEETQFLKSGREKGAITQNGLSMLKLQAEKAWEIWNS
jgi:shikimate dehydrogenase